MKPKHFASVIVCSVFGFLAFCLATLYINTTPAIAAGGNFAPVAASTPCTQNWQIVSNPDPTGVGAGLYGVAVEAPNNVWAVGSYRPDNNSSRTLVKQWNGSQWSIVPSESMPGRNMLYAASVAGPDDVWAVGFYLSDTYHPLIMHWDGNFWSIIPSPDVPGQMLHDVEAITPNDVWAVGTAGLAVHWDGSEWTVVPTGTGGDLPGIKAFAPDDVWAVGTSGKQTLTLHWNGVQWAIVPSPNVGAGPNALYAVSGVSADDVWAVGTFTSSSGQYRTLMLHWNGVSWNVVPSPNVGDSDNGPVSVAAVGTNDVWATGYYFDTGASDDFPLVLHWDGAVWATVTVPGTSGLTAIAAVNANDVWAVGYHWDPNSAYSLIEHYTNPCVTPTPTNTGTPPTSTPSRTATPTRTATLTRTATQTSTITPTPTNTRTATNTPTPSSTVTGTPPTKTPTRVPTTTCCNPAATVTTTCTQPDYYYYDVTLTNPTANCGVYISGPVNIYFQVSNNPNSSGNWTTIDQYSAGYVSLGTAHIRGTFYEPGVPPPNAYYRIRWTMTYNHCLGDRFIEGFSIPAALCPASTPTPTITAATTSTTPTATHPTATTPVATPTRTTAPTLTGTPNIPGTATSSATSSAVAATPQPTFTVCAIQFSDVPAGSTFYPYIRCLACRGIVNGYGDGTFRPASDVTRGQLSKIVANAAGFSDPQSTQQFQDVPVGSTFHVYIGQLYSRGVIGGYPCGAPFEPCVPPGDLPYFRPGANATRGQITKIVANAAGFNHPPIGQQFQDVPPGSTYYTYTYQLVTRSIMSGYPCAGPGEPCVPPANLPYFRGNNNATRGQVSKIVANTFIPDCDTPATP
jgi:hypothetical protein